VPPSSPALTRYTAHGDFLLSFELSKELLPAAGQSVSRSHAIAVPICFERETDLTCCAESVSTNSLAWIDQPRRQLRQQLFRDRGRGLETPALAG